ncbi:GNAT family N-acetyltransferase [Streptomyces sp. NPDC001262]|uniref:GNAT family N-acetyltransferase n=1 Tax=Streptomyces sp. NPDC001262 TaxID=3364552 RepID=UPI0036987ED2
MSAATPGPGVNGAEGTAGTVGEGDTLELRTADAFTDELVHVLTQELQQGATQQQGEAQGGDFIELIACDRPSTPAAGRGPDLLDGLAEWGPVSTGEGPFQLVPVRVERDLPLVAQWMNDPAVAAFWELAGPESATADHLRAQLDGDGRSIPCLGVLGGVPMSYWEVYRADLDPVARHYPARPHDTGLHLLIGRVADRGRGIGTDLLRRVADHVLDHRPSCTRVVAEPDLRNTASVAAFLGAGFRLTREIELPGKRAGLMIRDRALRGLL